LFLLENHQSLGSSLGKVEFCKKVVLNKKTICFLISAAFIKDVNID